MQKDDVENSIVLRAYETRTFRLQLTYLLSFISAFSVFGQVSNTLSNAEIDSLILLSDPVFPENRHFGVAYYQNLLKNSVANKHTSGIINSYFSLGEYYHFTDKQIDSSVYYFDQTILLIEKTGIYKRILAAAYNQKCGSLADSGMKYLALESLQKAYEIDLQQDNKDGMIIRQLNLAELNRDLQNNERAIEIATKVLKDSTLENYRKGTLNAIIGSSLIQLKKPKEGLLFLEIADSIYQKNRWEDIEIINVRTYVAQAYLDLGDLKKSIQLCESIRAEFPDSMKSMNVTNLVLGKALLQSGRARRAIQVLEKALIVNRNEEKKIPILETLGFAYLSQNNVEKSEPLFTEATVLRDSIQDSRAKRFSSYSSISYNLLETQYKNDNLVHKNETLEAKAVEREYLLSVLVLSITVMLLSILGYILWKKYHTGKNTIISLKANEKAILEAQIKLREDELSATMVHFSKNMKTIENILKDMDASLAKKDFGALEMIKKELHDYQKSSSAISLLTDRIESQYPGISMQLRTLYPNFSPNDIKHCLMIKLGLSLKETAQLFNITIAAVKSARGRMRKKMGLDPDISLKQHLSNIAKSA